MAGVVVVCCNNSHGERDGNGKAKKKRNGGMQMNADSAGKGIELKQSTPVLGVAHLLLPILAIS